MPKPPTPDGVCELRVDGFVGGFLPWRNYLYFSMPPAGVPIRSDLAAIANDLQSLWLTVWGGMASRDAILSTCRFRLYTSSGVLEVLNRLDAPGSGDNVDVAAAAARIRWDILTSSRQRGGSTFVCGIPRDVYTAGSLFTDPPASGWETDANAFISNVAATSSGPFPVVRLAVVHRRQSSAWLPVATISPVVGARIDPKVSTQVRRMRA